MNRDDLVRFATRDWAAIEQDKAHYWAERKKSMSPAEALAMGNDMRVHALAVRPAAPDAGDRDADADTHRRVSEALRAVTNQSAR